MKLIALTPYGGKTVGDVFDVANERQARVLISLRKAKQAPDETAEEAPKPAAVKKAPTKRVTKRITKRVTKDLKADDDKPKRTYRRRDMSGETETK